MIITNIKKNKINNWIKLNYKKTLLGLINSIFDDFSKFDIFAILYLF